MNADFVGMHAFAADIIADSDDAAAAPAVAFPNIDKDFAAAAVDTVDAVDVVLIDDVFGD